MMAMFQPPDPAEPTPLTEVPGRTGIVGGATRIPRPLTPLIARDVEVAQIASLLHDPGVRLLTLTGPGGVGKTRLAIAAATAAADRFPDGQAFIDLSPVRDPDLVLTTVANSLGLRDMGAEPLHDRLSTVIADRRLLLVLDNFEQVVVAAPRLLELLDTCSELALLITSRIRLRISGEREFPVTPLPIDTPADAGEAEVSGAIRLFFERARATQPHVGPGAETTPAVAEIVRRVDGLPLAIELAAARITSLPPASLLQRLEQRLPLLSGGARDLPLRQQTMRDTIGWSYDLLDDAGQRLFRRLGIFVGGFTLEAAEAIVADQTGSDGVSRPAVPFEVLEGITALIEHSLLRQSEGHDGAPRYRMLETVREYARERLADSGERDLMHARHAAYYLALAEDGGMALTGPVSTEWLATLDRERGNLRAALHRTLEQHDVERATRLGAALWRFWEHRRELIEGRAHLEAILDLPADPDLAASRYRVLVGAGVLAALQADYDRAVHHCEDALAGWRQLGDRRGIARSLLCLTAIARYRDDYAGSETLGQETLATFRSIADRWGIGHVLANLGMVAWVQGDHAGGTARYEEALTHLREVDDTSGIFEVVLELGKGASDAGDLARATLLLEECLALSATIGDGASRGEALTELGVVAYRQGEHLRAGQLFTEAGALAQDSGDRRQLAWVTAHHGDVDLAIGNTGSAATRYAEALTLFLSMNNRVGIAQCLEAIARVAAMRDHPAPAIRLLASCTTLFAAIGATPPPDRDPATDIASLKSNTTPEEFDRAWTAGRALSPEDAATEALALAAELAAGAPSAMTTDEEQARTVPPAAPDAAVDLAASLGLTPREIEVLRLLAEGISDREIADTLSISERTAGNHVQHAMQKIGVESRTAAAVFAVRHGLDRV